MLDRIISHRLGKAKKSVLLLGARQVGKSTLLKSLGPDLYINLADEELFLSYSKDPGRLKREILALQKKSVIVVDEVQRVPSLLNSIQALIDFGVPHRFLMTGSSARKLKRGGANLLPGRILLEHLDPLSVWEMEKHFDLEKALTRGMLPGVYFDDAEGLEILDSYVNTYLREEIQSEAVSKNLGSYARFLDAAAIESGRWLNYSKVASDTEIPKETIRRYYQVLEDTLLAFRIPSYQSKKHDRRVAQKDRYLLFDVGVRNALLKIHRSRMSETERGIIFEQWMILQCLYFIRSFKKDWTLYSYRSDGGAEVDLIIETHKELIAIECKYGKVVTQAQLRGLTSFEEIADKPVKKFVVYRGETRQFFNNKVVVEPFLKFLLKTLPGF